MRFRLMSYVAAMLLLAGMLGVNLIGTPCTHPDGAFLAREAVTYGWPFTAAMRWLSHPSMREWEPPPTEAFVYQHGQWHVVWHWGSLFADVVVGVVVAFCGLVACERLLRRFAPNSEAK